MNRLIGITTGANNCRFVVYNSLIM